MAGGLARQVARRTPHASCLLETLRRVGRSSSRPKRSPEIIERCRSLLLEIGAGMLGRPYLGEQGLTWSRLSASRLCGTVRPGCTCQEQDSNQYRSASEPRPPTTAHTAGLSLIAICLIRSRDVCA